MSKLGCTAEHWNLFRLCNSLNFSLLFPPHYLSLTFAFNISSSSILQFLIFKDVIGHAISFTLLTLTCPFLSIKLFIITLQFSPDGRVNSKRWHSSYFSPLPVYTGNFSIYSKVFCSSLLDHAPPYIITCSLIVPPSLASYLFKGKTCFLQILRLNTVPDVYIVTDEWRWGEGEKAGEKRKRKEDGEKKLVNSFWRILFIKEKNKILKLWKPIIPMHSIWQNHSNDFSVWSLEMTWLIGERILSCGEIGQVKQLFVF